MSSQLLVNKEPNFLELNKELQEKVKSLMTEVELILNNQKDAVQGQVHDCRMQGNKMQQNKSQNTNKSDSEELNKESLSCRKSRINDFINNRIITNDNQLDKNGDENYLKNKKAKSANQTIINFLKSEIIKLQKQIQIAQNEIKKKDETCIILESIIKTHEEKKDQLYNELDVHKESIKKTEVLNSELKLKLLLQQKEIGSFRKEIEELKKNLKSLSKLTSNGDIRLNRSLEENEKLRSFIKIYQVAGKELREQIKKIQEENKSTLKNSEKQHSEILQAFKKQTQLVDNLKKQKAYLEANKEVQFLADDFTKLLEWTPIVT